jgi:Fur family ferric uptake transcriptional regulator
VDHLDSVLIATLLQNNKKIQLQLDCNCILGMIHSFSGKDGLTWYAACKQCSQGEHHDQHAHFQCRKCGRMECLEVSLPIPKIKDHKVDSEIVLLVGECSHCLS